jgi:hypothetical protein
MFNPPSTPLPENFPSGIAPPKFQIGDRVRWHPIPDEEFGVVTGFEYAPAEHLQHWYWQYVVRLDPASPSSSRIVAETAWENDIELADASELPRGEGEEAT